MARAACNLFNNRVCVLSLETHLKFIRLYITQLITQQMEMSISSNV